MNFLDRRLVSRGNKTLLPRPPAIYETPMICRHLRQDVVSNPACGWWIVDCYMLEHRKEQKCLIQPFYKKIPLPGSILNSHLSNLSFLVDSWYHLVGIWESRRMLNISFINIFRIPLLSPTCLFCTTLLPLRSMSNKKMQRMLHFLFILFT